MVSAQVQWLESVSEGFAHPILTIQDPDKL